MHADVHFQEQIGETSWMQNAKEGVSVRGGCASTSHPSGDFVVTDINFRVRSAPNIGRPAFWKRGANGPPDRVRDRQDLAFSHVLWEIQTRA